MLLPLLLALCAQAQEAPPAEPEVEQAEEAQAVEEVAPVPSVTTVDLSTSTAPAPRPKPRGIVDGGFKWTVFGVGAVSGVAGVGVAAMTFSESRDLIADGDQLAYEELRPLNNGAWVLAGVGGVLAITALLLPERKVSVTLSPTGIGLRGRLP